MGGGRGWERTDSRNQGKLWRSKVMSEKLPEGSVMSRSEGRKSQACGFREVITWCDRVKGVSPCRLLKEREKQRGQVTLCHRRFRQDLGTRVQMEN